jgi:hypothetical protein
MADLFRQYEPDKIRTADESELKTHITILGINTHHNEKKVDLLLRHVRDRVAKCFTPTFVELVRRVGEKYYDIAVGFRYDEEAINYVVYHTKKILIDRKGQLH